MENPSDLEDNMQVLEEELLILNDLRYVGDGQMDEWLQDVRHKPGEMEKLRKEFNELKTGIDPTNVDVRLELTMKVVEVLKDIRLLKQEANGHRESLESLLLELGIEKPKQYSYEDLSSFTSNFSIKVGQGASANIYKGQLPSGVQVAVKLLVEHDVVKEMFMAEVRTMGRTYHRNLIKLYGFCFDQHKKALVYEYMENGSLDRVLYQNQHSIEWEKLYGIATDIAKAIAYLHDGCSEQIIHHDVKAANVLLDSKFSPKVTDFGLAKLLNRDRSHITLSRIRGTPGYLAPEMWMPASLVTYKCDVYSYGMLLFEVLGRRNNSRNNNQWFPKQVWDKFETGQLDEMIYECGIAGNNREKATVLSMVAFWCAQFTAEVRPTMSTVVKMLENEIPIKMPPNPFFPSNLVPPIQNLPEVNLPKVAASISVQPSHSPEVNRSTVTDSDQLQSSHQPEVNRSTVTDSDQLQSSHQPEVINPKVSSISLQPSDMPAVIQPNLTVTIPVQPSDLKEVTSPKVNAFISPQPLDLSEVIRPKDFAFFSLQPSDFLGMNQAKFSASSSTQPSHSQKTAQPKTTHSVDRSLHEKQYREQGKNSSNKEFTSSSALESSKSNRRFQSLLPTSWAQLFPRLIVGRKRSGRKTEFIDTITIEPLKEAQKPLGDGNAYDRNLTGVYTGEKTTVSPIKVEITNMGKKDLLFFRNPARIFDMDVLLKASAEVLGKGTIGTTYKALLDVGTVVTVKRLKTMTISEGVFREKIEILGAMNHKNVVPLMAYYYHKDEKLILSDYMDNGSLSNLLHGNQETGRTPLDWETRLQIAFGAVSGIEYLHSLGPGVSHGNIKSSNILITKDYDGLVSDFSLAQLLTHGSNSKRVSSGYCAPELTDLCSTSQKADVYSFGIVLLELLTGKPATIGNLNEEAIDLRKWVHSTVREEWTAEIFDIELLKYQEIEEWMVMLLQLAVDCVFQYPEKRPTVTEVAKRIEEMRHFTIFVT